MKSIVLAMGALLLGAIVPAVAADMPVRKMPVKAPPMVDPVANWTGFYIGAHGGYAWADTDYTSTIAGIGQVASGSLDQKGGLGGGQVGFDYNLGNHLVIGFVADIAATDVKGSTVVDPQNQLPTVLSTKLEWLATFRGRIGIETGPALFYATGGLAVARAKAHGTNLINPFAEGEGSNTFTGWTAGAGVEYMITPNVSVMAEYLHIGLSEGDIALAPSPIVGGNTSDIDIVKAGINFRFGGTPISARY